MILVRLGWLVISFKKTLKHLVIRTDYSKSYLSDTIFDSFQLT